MYCGLIVSSKSEIECDLKITTHLKEKSFEKQEKTCSLTSFLSKLLWSCVMSTRAEQCFYVHHQKCNTHKYYLKSIRGRRKMFVVILIILIDIVLQSLRYFDSFSTTNPINELFCLI